MNTYGKKAFWLNEIISHMNDEGAYMAWIYLWPDGTSSKDVDDYFGTKEEYEELEKYFVKIYQRYHRHGLYSYRGISEEILKKAHEWDDKLGLVHIVDVEVEKMPLAQDQMDRDILEVLSNNDITKEVKIEIEDEVDRDYPDEPYKCLYLSTDNDAKNVYKVLKASKKWLTVKIYEDFWGPDGYSNLEVIVSNYPNDETNEKEVN